MNAHSKQLEIKIRPPSRKGATPRLPHERDESEDSQQSGTREELDQAHKDVMSGQVDTDLRGERGLDAVVNQTPGVSPLNPKDLPPKPPKK